MFTKLRFLIATLVLNLVCSPFSALAAEGLDPQRKSFFNGDRGSFWVGLGPIAGDVTYRIGNYSSGQAGNQSFEVRSPFPMSKLQFLLNSLMLTLGGELCFFQKAECRIAFSKNLTNKPGNMNDTDWTVDSNLPFARTTYSESNTLFKGYIIDIGFRYWLLNKQFSRGLALSLAPGVSLLYQQFSWDCANGVQVDVQSGEKQDLIGPDLYYKFTLVIPLIDLAAKMTLKRFSFLAFFGYSPRVLAYDKDYHLLRYRLTTTKAYGEGLKFGFQSRFDFHKHWFLHFGADYLQVKARGMDQNKYYSSKNPDTLSKNDMTWSTDHHIKSYQTSIKGGIGFKF